MLDHITREPLIVSTEGRAGPYIAVHVDQADRVTRLLVAHGVAYALLPDEVSRGGVAVVTSIELPRSINVNKVQALLDSEP